MIASLFHMTYNSLNITCLYSIDGERSYLIQEKEMASRGMGSIKAGYFVLKLMSIW